MSQEKYIVEIRVDLDNYDGDEDGLAQRKEIMRELIKRGAASILAGMNLMPLKRPPQVGVTAGDYFMSREEIDIITQDEIL